jgi:antitoxin YefM
MQTVPVQRAGEQLAAIINQLVPDAPTVGITRDGTVVAVLVQPDYLASLEETVAVLSDPTARERIDRARTELSSGAGLSHRELTEYLTSPPDQ